ncbi:Aste57867_19047 [Aphanomyces stellatus]|uniref:Aste57867_19047 protein n=1 Tax=Aphanomyces stellatus TaxID=120398 RepID=A0A485LC93_9STRA|nr:hypothetical protein As57867_018983 [Aphanomyces stellatus]VFT95772.1 Aste57867_19047 [Aphanomyces stellatus]
MAAEPSETLFEREDEEEEHENTTHRDRAHSLEDLELSDDEESTMRVDSATGSVKRTLDPAMMNELLLVCSNLGVLTETEDGSTIFTRGEDCEEWVHDLQRAIRRDHATYRLVGKTLGRWKILQKKLLPLLINHQNDWSLVFSILKVLVMLTMKPTNESDNIAVQLNYLRGYKHAFLQHGVIQVLMAILVEPLSREGSSRTPQDYLNMELVLTLFRNLLAVPNEDVRLVTSATNHMARLQEDLVAILHEENVFDMLLLFAEDIDAAENREWNLLVMEMFDLVLQASTPKQLVASIVPEGQNVNTSIAPESTLVSQLHKDNKSKSYNRHSNFGGMLILNGKMGRKTIVTDFNKTGDEVIPQAHRKAHKKQRNKGPGINDISEVFGSNVTTAVDGKSTLGLAIRYICDELLTKCYTSLTTSLKNEFRRGSAKLLPNDRLLYFHLIWFLTSYHRLKYPHLKKIQAQREAAFEKKKEEVFRTEGLDASLALEPPVSLLANYDQKAILSTLDMFSFNFVLQSIESFAEAKNHHGMMLSVKLLAEMIAMLTDLGTSSDIRLQRIGHSLQHKLFYERDFLDRLPILIKSWTPASFNKEYVTNVVTLTHLVLKMLDSQGSQLKVLQKRRQNQAKKAQKTKEDEESEEETEKLIEQEMRRKEVQFDTRKYFGSMISHESIKLYCYVLQEYKTNSPKVNHYIYAFFYRVQQFHAIEEGTMEPMLFNINALFIFNKMLQDHTIANRSEYAPFLDFIRTLVRNFFALSETNHLLFVECLVRHSYAPRTCALIQQKYKSLAMTKDAAPVKDDSSAIHERSYIPRQLDIEGETEFDMSMPFDPKPAAATVTSTEKPRKAAPKPRKPNAKSWSKIEDRYLAKMYSKYRHLPSVYEVISYEDMFQDRDRTPEQIERRVKQLKLHKKEHDSSSDEDESKKDGKDPWDDSDDDEEQPSEGTQNMPTEAPTRVNPDRGEKRRRLIREKVSNDDDSDDDFATQIKPPTTSVTDDMAPLAKPSPTSDDETHEGAAPMTAANFFMDDEPAPKPTKKRLIRKRSQEDDDDSEDEFDTLASTMTTQQESFEETMDDSIEDTIEDDSVEDSVADESKAEEGSSPKRPRLGSAEAPNEESENYTFEQSYDIHRLCQTKNETHFLNLEALGFSRPGLSLSLSMGSGDEANNDDEGLELLQRARLLVQAATNLPDFSTLFSKPFIAEPESEPKSPSQLQPVPPKGRTKPKASKAGRSDNQHGNDGDAAESSKPTSPALKHEVAKSPVKEKPKKKKKPPVEVVDEIDHAEKQAAEALARKYAQERAAARVAAKLREKAEEVEKEEQSKAECVQEFYESLEEKERRLKEDRKKAKERLKALREKQKHDDASSTDEKPEKDVPVKSNPGQIEKFQQQTKERLLRAKEQKRQAELLKQEQLKRDEDEKLKHKEAEADAAEESKRRAEKLRKETTRRLKAMQAHKDDVERKEVERRQQGLEKYKHHKEEMERVAKGVPPSVPKPKSKPAADAVAEGPDDALSNDESQADIAQSKEVVVVEPLSTREVEVEPEDEITPEDHDDVDSSPSPTSEKVDLPPILPPVELKAKKPPQKKALWKRPPVPIPTTEDIVHRSKLMPPVANVPPPRNDSYAERMKSRSAPSSLNSQAERLASATRERAKEMDKSKSK